MGFLSRHSIHAGSGRISNREKKVKSQNIHGITWNVIASTSTEYIVLLNNIHLQISAYKNLDQWTMTEKNVCKIIETYIQETTRRTLWSSWSTDLNYQHSFVVIKKLFMTKYYIWNYVFYNLLIYVNFSVSLLLKLVFHCCKTQIASICSIWWVRKKLESYWQLAFELVHSHAITYKVFMLRHDDGVSYAMRVGRKE